MILSFEALLQIHKQEAAEGMAIVAALFVVILGILGYLGSAQRISLIPRCGIFLAFALYTLGSLIALNSSLLMHNAIHTEIVHRIQSSPDLVTTCAYRNALATLDDISVTLLIGAIIAICILLAIAIFRVGDGNISQYLRARRSSKSASGTPE